MRELGWYWVRMIATWEVARWADTHKCWQVIFDENLYDDTDFAEIDERPIVREDKSHDA